ncbi:MAG: hypothetical protein HYY23_18600 [Verrucomicrobia bacterium]|nr:hypothetical protein [Verrucomicrobiota bacterium]
MSQTKHTAPRQREVVTDRTRLSAQPASFPAEITVEEGTAGEPFFLPRILFTEESADDGSVESPTATGA